MSNWQRLGISILITAAVVGLVAGIVVLVHFYPIADDILIGLLGFCILVIIVHIVIWDWEE